MGDEITLGAAGNVNLKASAPLPARFVVFKNGEQVFQMRDVAEISFAAKEPGAYRMEVYLENLGAPFNEMSWIISNPIYVR